MHDHRASGFLHGTQQGLLVQGRESPQVYDLCVDALCRQHLGRGENLRHHAGPGDEADVRAGTLDIRLADRNDVLSLRNIALHSQHQLVFQEHHGVVVADGSFQESLGVRRRTGHDHLDAWNMSEPRFIGLRMLGCRRNSGADGGADHHRDFCLAAEHVAHLGRLIVQFVQADAHEVGEHDLHDRTQPRSGGAHSEPHDRRFGNWRVHNAFLAELLQARNTPGFLRISMRMPSLIASL